MDKSGQLRMTVYSSLMAALTAAGAYIAIPIGPVPVVLQNMFVLLTGILLGRRWGLASIAVYLLAGACGLPVFAGGLGGIGRFVGPTGGYLIGYLPAVFVVGLISDHTRANVVWDIAAMACGVVVIYAFGVSWLKVLMDLTWFNAVVVGMNPVFLIADALKVIGAAAIAGAIRPVIHRYGVVEIS